jgi:hypothetical protein
LASAPVRYHRRLPSWSHLRVLRRPARLRHPLMAYAVATMASMTARWAV